jgi:hypothetical protein
MKKVVSLPCSQEPVSAVHSCTLFCTKCHGHVGGGTHPASFSGDTDSNFELKPAILTSDFLWFFVPPGECQDTSGIGHYHFYILPSSFVTNHI